MSQGVKGTGADTRAERGREATRRYYATHREKANAAVAAWQAANPEKASAHNAAYRAANPEKRKAAIAAWCKAHPKARCAIQSRRRAAKLGAAGVATVAEIAARWTYYGNKCWVCGGIATATDHVKPLVKGGSNWPANLRPVCQSCNSSKRDKWPFRAARRAA